MTKARIYQPDKNAMQSGKARLGQWKLEFIPEKAGFVDNLMGWNGMTDMPQEIHLFFPDKEAAIVYAKAQRIPYEVSALNKRKQVRKAYADNFKFNKATS